MLWRYSRKESKVLLVATLLLFTGYGLLLARDMQLVRRNDLMLTAQTVGVFVGVEENGINTLASQLDARARELDAREAMLVQAGTSTDARTLLLVAVVGAGLLGLILLNFYLDSKKRGSLS